jgi:hypothetical protein
VARTSVCARTSLLQINSLQGGFLESVGIDWRRSSWDEETSGLSSSSNAFRTATVRSLRIISGLRSLRILCVLCVKSTNARPLNQENRPRTIFRGSFQRAWVSTGSMFMGRGNVRLISSPSNAFPNRDCKERYRTLRTVRDFPISIALSDLLWWGRL